MHTWIAVLGISLIGGADTVDDPEQAPVLTELVGGLLDEQGTVPTVVTEITQTAAGTIDFLTRAPDGPPVARQSSSEPLPASTPTDWQPRSVGVSPVEAISIGTILALVGSCAFLFSRLRDDDVLEHPTRARILASIEDRPGMTKQDLRRSMEVAWGTIVHHVRVLERHGHIVGQRDGGRTGYWLPGSASPLYRQQASALTCETRRRIASHIVASPGVHAAQISRAVQATPATISKHLRRLWADGLVHIDRQASVRRIFPTEDLRSLAASASP